MNTLPPEWYADHAPVDYDRRPQQRLFTADETLFAFFIGGFAGCMGTVGLAFVWSWFL